MGLSGIVERPFSGVHGPAIRTPVPAELPTARSLAEVSALQHALGEVFLRISEGPEVDELGPVRDGESGYVLPGMPAWPLQPEGWWAGTSEEWMARQIAQHAFLIARGGRPWLLTGRVVARGPHGEPVVARVKPVAFLGPAVAVEAEDTYVAWRCRQFR